MGRYTACVFHLLGVLQVSLALLAKSLRVKFDSNATWEMVIRTIEAAIKAKQTSTPKRSWSRMEPFYTEAVLDLRAIKNAWRNPTMHFRRKYDESQALRVYETVGEFLGHLATRLHE